MDSNSRFYISILTFLTLVASIALAWLSANLPTGLKIYLCNPESCTLQDWLSASAGWVGFIAAAIGAYFIFHQLSEQRKQTAFILGDGLPSLDIKLAATSSRSGTFVVTNWNRRNVGLGAIRFKFGESCPQPTQFYYNHPSASAQTKYSKIDDKGFIVDPPPLTGWINRQDAPDQITFHVEFAEGVTSEHFGDQNSDVLTELEIFFPSERGRGLKTIQLQSSRRNVFPTPVSVLKAERDAAGKNPKDARKHKQLFSRLPVEHIR
jgi:hypothetical protein